MKCCKCVQPATTRVRSTIFPRLETWYCDQHKPRPTLFAPRHLAIGLETTKPSGWTITSSPQSVLRIGLGGKGFGRAFYPIYRTPFEHWHIEDMIYPGHTALVIAEGCDFLPWVEKVASKYDIILCDFMAAELGWNRDPVLRTMDGPSIFREGDSGRTGAGKKLKARAIYKDRPLKPHESLGGILTSRVAKRQLKGPPFGTHCEPLAGGNVITARNKLNELKFIVGEFGLYGVWHAESFGSKMSITEADYSDKALLSRALRSGYDPEQYLLWKNAKHRIRKTLLSSACLAREASVATAKKCVFFVPQWAYHIDMQMLYVGRGTVVLHSFQKQLELIRLFFFRRSPGPRGAVIDALGDSLFKVVATLHEAYGAIILKTKELLEKHGFDVIEVAGTFPTHVKDGHLDKSSDLTHGKYYFNFMNGIALFPDKVLILHDVDIKEQFISFAYDLFEEQLRDAGIEVVPLGSHLPLPQGKRHSLNSNEFMYREGGGLRCKTTTLPRDYVEGLTAITLDEQRLAREARAKELKRQEEEKKERERGRPTYEDTVERLKRAGLWFDEISASTLKTLVQQGKTERIFQVLAQMKEDGYQDKNGALLDIMDE